MIDLTNRGGHTVQPRGGEVITKSVLQDDETLGAINAKPLNGWLARARAEMQASDKVAAQRMTGTQAQYDAQQKARRKSPSRL